MRQFQIAVFVLGAVALLLAAFFIGKDMGDTLWRTWHGDPAVRCGVPAIVAVPKASIGRVAALNTRGPGPWSDPVSARVK